MQGVKSFGARGDGTALDSPFLQKAIDACAALGGGTVYLPEGRYLCATVHLCSRVHLLLDRGTTILGSRNPDDFDPYEADAANTEFQDRSHSYFHHSLFHADGAEDIAITGLGTIDMQSAWEESELTEFGSGENRGQRWCRGAKAIAFKECKNVVLRDLTIRRVTDLAVYVAGCENVVISGLNIATHVDGISPDCCKNVVISDCIVDAGDDAIVPKCSFTLGRLKAMENLTITGCVIRSSASAIKFGTESNSAYLNTTVTGCTVYDTGMEGLFIATTDGALVEGLSVSNVTMKNVAQPLLLMVGNRARAPKGTPIGEMRNVAVSNLLITGPYTDTVRETMAQNASDHYKNDLIKPFLPMPLIISGQEDSVIKNVSLSNVIFSAPGGGSAADGALKMKDVREEYPMAEAFGKRAPVYGLYARHVNGLRLYNVDFSTALPDAREEMLLESVTGFHRI